MQDSGGALLGLAIMELGELVSVDVRRGLLNPYWFEDDDCLRVEVTRRAKTSLIALFESAFSLLLNLLGAEQTCRRMEVGLSSCCYFCYCETGPTEQETHVLYHTRDNLEKNIKKVEPPLVFDHLVAPRILNRAQKSVHFFRRLFQITTATAAVNKLTRHIVVDGDKQWQWRAPDHLRTVIHCSSTSRRQVAAAAKTKMLQQSAVNPVRALNHQK